MNDNLADMSRNELLAECSKLRRALKDNERFADNTARAMRREHWQFALDYKWIADFASQLMMRESNGWIQVTDGLKEKMEQLALFQKRMYRKSDSFSLNSLRPDGVSCDENWRRSLDLACRAMDCLEEAVESLNRFRDVTEIPRSRLESNSESNGGEHHGE